MVILGLLLILLGGLTIVAVVFDLDSVSTANLLGADLSSMTVFFLGVASGVAILWGFGILKFGTKRSLQHRRESKKLNELNEKLDRADAEKKHDHDNDNDEER